ncbi:cytochrome P450 [Flectobacillus major]|uniref:cytochrome P450 n=1 Tax=Flectobacillus major TaxID=103 RepID=UPI0004292FF4|nr:cytochrome P450 [Flectobacillus major]
MLPKKVPSVKGVFFFGHALEFGRDPLTFMLNIQKNYKRFAQLRIVHLKINLILTAEDAKYVLQENNKSFIKGRAYRVLSMVLGNGMLTSNGDFWHRQRKLAQPAFYKQRLALLVDTISDETNLLIKNWQGQLAESNGKKTVQIPKEMMATTLKIVTKALFGTDIDPEKIEQISFDIDELNELASIQMRTPIRLPLWIPSRFNQRFKTSSSRVHAVIQEIISTRRNILENNPNAEFDDLMQMLITAKDEETGEQMSDQQLKDEIITLFLAGHETTAMAMSWALYLLAQHPAVVQKMRNEIKEVLGDSTTPHYDSMRTLPYSMQVIQEVLRLYPPAWAFSRQVLNDEVVGGYLIPKNQQVLINTYILHRNTAYWDNPEVFNPDNFLPEKIKERPTYAYLPFGGGPRLCIGNNFALMEMQIMLVALVRHFDFDPIETVIPEPQITLKPKGGMKLRVSQRC